MDLYNTCFISFYKNCLKLRFLADDFLSLIKIFQFIKVKFYFFGHLEAENIQWRKSLRDSITELTLGTEHDKNMSVFNKSDTEGCYLAQGVKKEILCRWELWASISPVTHIICAMVNGEQWFWVNG